MKNLSRPFPHPDVFDAAILNVISDGRTHVLFPELTEEVGDYLNISSDDRKVVASSVEIRTLLEYRVRSEANALQLDGLIEGDSVFSIDTVELRISPNPPMKPIEVAPAP